MADGDDYTYEPTAPVTSIFGANSAMQGSSLDARPPASTGGTVYHYGMSGPPSGTIIHAAPSAPFVGGRGGGAAMARSYDEQQRNALMQSHYNQQAAIQSSHNAALEAVAQAHVAAEQSRVHYENAKAYNQLVNEAKDYNDAAGFLSAHASLNQSAPEYPSQVAALASQFSRASNNKIVQDYINNADKRLAMMQEEQIKGGVAGPATTKKAMEEGIITPELLNANKNVFMNANGGLNHWHS
jgi:hypothetical protein